MTTATKRTQRYWDDVSEGDELPGYSLALTPTRIVLQVSGSQDWNPLHHDPEHARSAGHPDIFVNTGFTTACYGRLLSDYAGERGWVKKLSMQMRRMNHPGDLMSMKGKVVRKYRQGDERLVDLEVWVENARIGVTSPGAATVRLPARDPAASG